MMAFIGTQLDSLKTLRYYGSVDDIDDNYCWLFIEDAGIKSFCRSQQSHREAAAKWLAVMHTCASKVAAVDRLSVRDTVHRWLGERRDGPLVKSFGTALTYLKLRARVWV